MAYSNGLSSVTFGVPTLTGYVVQSFDLSKKNQVAVEIFDESGVRKHERYDDLTQELSLDLVVNGGAEPIPGDVLTYNGVKYVVLEVAQKGTNKDFVKLSVKGKKSAGITLP